MIGPGKTAMMLDLEQARELLIKADEHIMRMGKIVEQQAVIIKQQVDMTNLANASLQRYIAEYKRISEPALRLKEEANNGHG